MSHHHRYPRFSADQRRPHRHTAENSPLSRFGWITIGLFIGALVIVLAISQLPSRTATETPLNTDGISTVQQVPWEAQIWSIANGLPKAVTHHEQPVAVNDTVFYSLDRGEQLFKLNNAWAHTLYVASTAFLSSDNVKQVKPGEALLLEFGGIYRIGPADYRQAQNPDNPEQWVLDLQYRQK